MNDEPSAPSPWAHLRAVLVVLHLFAITFQALPSVGGGLSRSAWRTPTVQGEFQAWSTRLQSLGFSITLTELEDQLWDFAVGYEQGRRAILRPFLPYLRYCGTWQTWRMFVAPHRFPGRLEIEIDRGQGWETIYVARSDEHEWRRTWLDHDRFRAAVFRYAWKHYRKGRTEFTAWVSRQVGEDYPDAKRVRVSFLRYRTPSPEEVRAGTPIEEKRVLKNVRKVVRP
ncbi:MAG: hypothetical protein AAGA48_39700 [Myxococcota bacterium]